MNSFVASVSERVVTSILSLWDYALTRMGIWYDAVMEHRLLTESQSLLIILLVGLFFFLPVIFLWSRDPSKRSFAVEYGFLTIVIALAVLFMTPSGFVGTPDENCDRYEGRGMMFTLMGHLTVPMRRTDIYGDKWLILIVQNARWGDDVHLCRISLTGDKARVLAKDIADAKLESSDGGRFSESRFTFSFGRPNEIPNVMIKSLPAFQKTSPPESPMGTVSPPASDSSALLR
ncbi:MAG TPA: hypothetical protein VMU13_02035 [Candidatus Paceibacterota bacterium]|nr:hypothetical protein [Candidatus Paceibacterota bacterium]